MHRCRRCCAGAALAALVLCTSIGHAQDVTEPALRAAFIYNVAKFTEWPEDALPAKGAFTACVLGDVPIGDALERSMKGRQLSGRVITVLRVKVEGPLRSCHLLYVSGVKTTQLAAIVATIQGAPVLTLSDIDGFAETGGILHMFVENGKLRFDLNLELAKRVRLRLSSQLLVLAAHVRGIPGAQE